MAFKENLNRLCQERGTKLTPVLKELGYSSSKVTAINNGQLPKEDTLIELAQYLHCSVADFFANNSAAVSKATAQDEDEEDILRVYRSLPRRAKHEFMCMAYGFENKKESDENNDATKEI